MRLSEMGPGRDDAPLPAEVEAELSALDAALAGDDVPAGMEGLETLVSDLRAERSTPESEFGDALDRWAAAGFPRGRRPGLSTKATASDAGGRFRLFLASLTPRKLAYAGGAAATLVVLVVGVSQIDFETSGTTTTTRVSARAAREEAAPEPGRVRGDLDAAQAPAVTEALDDASRAAQRRPSVTSGTLRTPNGLRPGRRPGGAEGRARRADDAGRARRRGPGRDQRGDHRGRVESRRRRVLADLGHRRPGAGDAAALDPDPHARHHARPALRPRRREVAERGHRRHHPAVRRRQGRAGGPAGRARGPDQPDPGRRHRGGARPAPRPPRSAARTRSPRRRPSSTASRTGLSCRA